MEKGSGHLGQSQGEMWNSNVNNRFPLCHVLLFY